jgi:hypothetical protein
MPTHAVLGGKVNIYRRGEGKFWQCSASVGGKQFRTSTKEKSLELAKQVAEDWYLTLRGKDRAGLDTDQELGAVLDRLERATMVALDPSVLFPGADLKPSCSLSCSRRTP